MAISPVRRGSRNSGKSLPLRKPRDLHTDCPGAHLLSPGPVCVAPGYPLGIAFARASATELRDIQRHEALGNEPEPASKRVPDVSGKRARKAAVSEKLSLVIVDLLAHRSGRQTEPLCI